MALIQTAQVAEWLGWSADKVTERQADLTRVAEAASTGIRRMCGRAFEPANGQARIFDVPMTAFELLTGDVRAVTAVDVRRSVSQDWSPVEAGGWQLRYGARRDWPFQSIIRTDGYFFPAGTQVVRITGDWEFETVPPSIEQATLMLAAKLLARAQSPKQVATSFTGAEVDFGSYFDFDIMELVNDFKTATGSVA